MNFYGRLDRRQWEMYALLLSEGELEHAARWKASCAKRNRELGKLVKVESWDGIDWQTCLIEEHGDSFMEKAFFSFADGEQLPTEEEWEEFVEDHTYRVTSPYDCSGQRFTAWIDLYVIKTGFWIYISSGYDV